MNYNTSELSRTHQCINYYASLSLPDNYILLLIEMKCNNYFVGFNFEVFLTFMVIGQRATGGK